LPAVALALPALAACASCGNGGNVTRLPGTPAGSGTLIVTARTTSGTPAQAGATSTRTVKLSLKVN
jgi:hypothetical protein